MKMLMITALLAGGVAAQAAETAPQVYRLAPEEIARAQADAAARRDVFDPSQWPVLPDRRVHGEVSAFVGTGGARGVSGVVAVPLGDSGSATFAFEQSRFNDRGVRRYYDPRLAR